MALGPDNSAGKGMSPLVTGITALDVPGEPETVDAVVFPPTLGAAADGAVGLRDPDSGPLHAMAYARPTAARVARPIVLNDRRGIRTPISPRTTRPSARVAGLNEAANDDARTLRRAAKDRVANGLWWG